MIRRLRAAAQLLHRPAGEQPAADVVRHLLAVQAQDPRSARLALRARGGVGLDRLVVGWLMRGTLHLVAREDYWWLHALTAPRQLTANARRLGQLGVDPDAAERALEIVERSLAADGPLTRPELAERIAAKGIPTEGQATPHLLMLAALRGVAAIHPGGGRFVLARDWLGDAPAPGDADRDAALAELGRRYLAAHAPARAEDLATWSGLPLRDARAALEAADPAPRQAPPDRIPPRLLPAFDPYLLGWKDRSFAVPDEHAKRIHPGGGMLRATATDDGLAVGTWSLRKGNVAIDPFAPLDPSVAVALEQEATHMLSL